MDMDVMFVIARLAVEREEDQPKHIERSEHGGEQADGIERMSAFDLERAEQDGVLTEETGEGRNSGDSQRGDEHGPVGVFDFFAEAAHLAHVLLAAHGVNDAASSKEEKRFEECVRHQMEDARRKGPDSASEEHVAELADGGVSEYALDVGLHEADGGGEEGGRASDDRHDDHGRLGVYE